MAAAVACSDPAERARRPAPATPREAAPDRNPRPAYVDPPAAPGAVAGRVTADGDALLAVWVEPADPAAAGSGSTRRGPHRVRYARFAEGRWTAPATIAEGDDVLANWADTPAVARGGDGALVAHWARLHPGGGFAYDVALARSTDDGATWTPLGVAHDDGTATEHGFVSMLRDPRGVRLFWLDGRRTARGHGDGATMLRTAVVSTRVGEDSVVDERVCDCCATAAAAVDGRPVVAYRDRSADEIRDITIARADREGWAHTSFADGWRIPGCPVNGPAVAAAGGALWVAWYTYAGERGSVRAAVSTDGGATFSAPIAIDGPRGRREPVGRVSIAAVTERDAVVSWIASDREDARIYARRVAADGRVGAERALAPTTPERDAGFPRVAPLGRDHLALLWTATAGERDGATRLRMLAIPLAELPPPAGAVSAPPARDAAGGLLAVGAPMPAATVARLDGTPTTLADAGGRAVLVNVWATWCEPCRHELPVLAALQRRYGDAGLRVVAVSVDRQRTAGELRAFAERRELPFSVWHDPHEALATALGGQTVPASFLFDGDGRLVWRRAGAIATGDVDLTRAVEAALAPRRPARR
ncbi:MAG: hypothetical protein D6689_21105 [Deltaproteobacteria bacterium]|nr:MAG: hypothetical protein D6689_21105 [Deltaproteobacteria bacterium]